MKPIVFIFLVLITLTFSSFTQWEITQDKDFYVKITLSKDKMEIQDILQIDLNLSYPSSFHPDINALKTNLSQNKSLLNYPLLLRKIVVDPAKNEKNISTQKISFFVEPQVAGQYDLTFLNIPFLPNDSSNQKPVQVISKIFPIEVTLPAINLNEIGTPLGLLTFSQALPIEMNSKNRYEAFNDPSRMKQEAYFNKKMIQDKSIPWLGIFSILLVILLFWITRQTTLPSTAIEDNAKKALTAKVKAIKNLENLKLKDLPSKKQFDSYYVKLTETVRQYIEQAYLIKAPEETTEEFLASVSQHPSFSSEQKEDFKNFLQKADRVKFAKHVPTPEESEEAWEAAEKLIKLS